MYTFLNSLIIITKTHDPPPRLSENPDLHPFEVILDTKKSGSSDLFFNPLPDLEN